MLKRNELLSHENVRRKLKCKSLSERGQSGKATDCLLSALFLLNSSGNNPYLSGYLHRDAEFSKSLSVKKKNGKEKEQTREGQGISFVPTLDFLLGPWNPQALALGAPGAQFVPC